MSQFSKPEGPEVANKDIAGMLTSKKVEAPTMSQVAEALGGKVLEQETLAVETEPVMLDGVEVPEEDKREFLRTLLAGEPFIKSYDLFGDFTVKFKTRTMVEQEEVDDELRSLTLESKDADVTKERLRLAKSLVSPDLEKTRASEVVFSSVVKAFRQFEGLCDLLYEKSSDINFWKPTGGTI